MISLGIWINSAGMIRANLKAYQSNPKVIHSLSFSPLFSFSSPSPFPSASLSCWNCSQEGESLKLLGATRWWGGALPESKSNMEERQLTSHWNSLPMNPVRHEMRYAPEQIPFGLTQILGLWHLTTKILNTAIQWKKKMILKAIKLHKSNPSSYPL